MDRYDTFAARYAASVARIMLKIAEPDPYAGSITEQQTGDQRVRGIIMGEVKLLNQYAGAAAGDVVEALQDLGEQVGAIAEDERRLYGSKPQPGVTST